MSSGSVRVRSVDVWLSADQKVIVSHDNHLQRVTGRDVRITETRAADLPYLRPVRELRRTSNFYTELQSELDETQEENHVNGKSEPIATLEEMFQEFPQVHAVCLLASEWPNGCLKVLKYSFWLVNSTTIL